MVVTAGSLGFGELIVRQFTKWSFKVVALDVRPPATPFPANAYFYEADVTDPDVVRRVAEQIMKEAGNPTVLINNAGVATGMAILDEPVDSIRRTFEVNIIAHFALVKEFLPYMIEKNHGHIVTMASVASFVTIASNVDYSCTKAAALAFNEGSDAGAET